MRNLRVVSALIAAVAAVLLAFTTVSAEAAQLPKHVFANVSAGGTNGHFHVKGNLTTGKGRNVYLQKKVNGKWTYVTKKKTKASSGYFYIAFGGRVNQCFQLVAYKSSTHRTTTKFVGCVRRS